MCMHQVNIDPSVGRGFFDTKGIYLRTRYIVIFTSPVTRISSLIKNNFMRLAKLPVQLAARLRIIRQGALLN